MTSIYRFKCCVNFHWVALTLLLLAAFLPATSGAVKTLKSGKYYIRLKKSQSCGQYRQYLAFSNKTCEAGTKKRPYGNTVGPLVRSITDGNDRYWKQWIIKIKGKTADGAYVATIHNYFNSKVGRIKCKGTLAAEKPKLCKKTDGKLASVAHIHPRSTDTWLIMPVGNAYNIIYNSPNRPSGCLRYLGASVNCNSRNAVLYTSDDGSGLQRWMLDSFKGTGEAEIKNEVIVPKGPGSPTKLNIVTITDTTVKISWQAGTAGTPEESYSVRCVNAGDPCTGAIQAETAADVARNVSVAEVVGLIKGKRYNCYVVARNSAGSVCSNALPIFTGTPPGKPTQVATGTVSSASALSTWYTTWEDGLAGNPEETYQIKCVTFGGKCTDTTVGTPAQGIKRGDGQGQVTNLPSGIPLSCYVIAFNSVGAVCSDEVSIQTKAVKSAPGKPTDISGNATSTLWMPTWQDGAQGTPTETYSAKCVAAGDPCTAAEVGNGISGISRGTQKGQVSGLAAGTAYSCYIIGENIVGSVCSAPYNVTTARKPQAPLNLNGKAGTRVFNGTWQDYETAATPLEQYQLKCVEKGGACSDPPQGNSTTGISRGTQKGQVTGLQPNTYYRCFAIAYNNGGSACSDGLDIKTAPLPGSVGITNNEAISYAVGEDVDQQWRAEWMDVPNGGDEMYTVKCVASGGKCTDATVGITMTVPRGVQKAEVTGLIAARNYTCFVVTSAGDDTACSAPYQVVTRAPTYFITNYYGGYVSVCKDESLLHCSTSVNGQLSAPLAIHYVGTKFYISNEGSRRSVLVCDDGMLQNCSKTSGNGTLVGPAGFFYDGSRYYITNELINTGSICDDALLTNCTSSNLGNLAVKPIGITKVDNRFYIATDSGVLICGESLTNCQFSNANGTINGGAGIVSVNGTIYIVSSYPNSVTICDRDLKQCRVSKGAGTFNFPFGIDYINGKWYVANRGDSTVSICLDPNLEKCSVTKAGDTLKGPTGFTVGFL